MDHQEWFEKFKIELGFDENRPYGQLWVKDRWTVIQAALLKMAIHSLPPLQKKVVQLIFFDDLSERKAAQKLGITKTKVHRLKAKALRILARSNFIKLALSPRLFKRSASAC